MSERLAYFLRLICPGKMYYYSTKIRIPRDQVDFRKFLIAKRVLQDGGSAIDGGGHIGYYTRFFSDLIQEGGKVHSFEPNPYMFHLLNKYAKYRPNVLAYKQALSNETARRAFYVEPFSLTQDSTLGEKRSKQKKISVETVKLDDLISDTENIRLIKLDIEGYEMQAVTGAKALVQRCRPWIICEYVQTEKRNDRKLISLLEEWNYSCLDIHTLKAVPPDKQIDLTDILAVPEEQQGRFLEVLNYF